MCFEFVLYTLTTAKRWKKFFLSIVNVGIYSQQRKIVFFEQLLFVKLTGKLQRLNNALFVSTQKFCGTPNIQLHFN